MFSGNKQPSHRLLVIMLPTQRKRTLLVTYGDSSGDSSSESSDQEQDATENSKVTESKRQKPMMLPDAVLKMFNDKENNKLSAGEGAEHGGRIRTFEHVEGDWASFVYIPVRTSPSLTSVLQCMVNKVKMKLSDIQLMPFQDLHISVSRTVSIRHYWIEPMIKKLRDAISIIKKFTCYLDLVEVYTNDEKTRTFIGIRVLIGEDKIKRLVNAVDAVYEEFGLEKYYEHPRFHLSFAWNLMDVSDDLDEDTLSSLQEIFNAVPSENETQWRKLDVHKLCFKTGNKVFHIPLT